MVLSARRGAAQGVGAVGLGTGSVRARVFPVKAGVAYVVTWMRILVFHAVTWGVSKIASKDDPPSSVTS